LRAADTQTSEGVPDNAVIVDAPVDGLRVFDAAEGFCEAVFD